MDLCSLLMEHQKAMFVGRDAELTLLKRCLAESESEWSFLHFHGPGGIGKTTLLRMFAQSVGPDRCIYLDGNGDLRSPEHFLAQLRRLLPDAAGQTDEIEMLNAYAARHHGVIVLLDTFERWGAIEDWLRDEWLPGLSPLVQLCSAGRYPLEGQWSRNGWGVLVKNIELQPLTSHEVRTYAHIRGIASREVVTSLIRLSNGLPLALSMACEIITRKGETLFPDQRETESIVAYLVEELTKDMREDHLKRYMEAAAMVWRFDQELLQALLQEPIAPRQFREFCWLPFVIRQGDSWSLHDSIRQWAFMDLRSRMPLTFRNYRRLALEALRQREALLPHKKTELAFERLYLHEDDFVRDFRFQMG